MITFQDYEFTVKLNISFGTSLLFSMTLLMLLVSLSGELWQKIKDFWPKLLTILSMLAIHHYVVQIVLILKKDCLTIALIRSITH